MYCVICTTPDCKAQYVGYTTRCFMSSRTPRQWSYDNHIKQENHEYKKVRFQILAQAPTNEINKELWLKRYLWTCQLGTLN